MPEIAAGDRAPDFAVETDQGRLTLSDLLAEGRLILAFYYEDMTPTCSTEVSSLKESFETFQEIGARILAVSSDSLESHRAFRERLGGVPFPLGSDPDLVLARAFGVVEESGKRARRAVFVVEPDRTVSLALPYYNPANVSQLGQVFEVLSRQA